MPKSLRSSSGTVVPTSWRDGPAAPRFNPGEAHVWLARIDRPAADRTRFTPMLSPDERTRAARFSQPQHRDRYVAARGILRDILSRYLDCGPAALSFSYAAHGKPAVIKPVGHRDVRFNMSHSGAYALYAVTEGREIGVDIEQIRERIDTLRLAARFFAPNETASLRDLPASERIAAFYRCWTRKEAYIKARGEGLTLALDQFEVSLEPGEPAALLQVHGELYKTERWALFDVETEPGYAAALAVERPIDQVTHWLWNQDH